MVVGRMILTVVDGFGFDTDVELTFRRDVVEVHHNGNCRAVFDRDHLREWLTYPEGTFSCDEVSLILSKDGILLRVEPGIPGCPLSGAGLGELRQWV